MGSGIEERYGPNSGELTTLSCPAEQLQAVKSKILLST